MFPFGITLHHAPLYTIRPAISTLATVTSLIYILTSLNRPKTALKSNHSLS